ncbi:hypothetical protein [Nocardioides xinjiangensis]|uniref:hypothetical protein n=1 Tax=Nocardioides xinjiangensis TaxID=2817376 RepID=UPI001B300F99|nr:hypothetical protein [Nocardioides sp. SYSU D00778]
MRRSLLLATALALTVPACSPAEPRGGEDPSPPTKGAAADDGEDGEVSGDGGTEPGAELAFGEPAVLVWQPTRDVTGELELTVAAVAEQRPSVFDGWAGDEAVDEARPYFATVTLANVGDADLGGQDVPLYLRDTVGSLGAPWTVGGDFEACQSGPLPDPFEPGAEAEMCLVYLVPEGGRVRDLVFQPTEGYDPISWSGEVRRPAAERPGARTPGKARRGERGRRSGRG